MAHESPHDRLRKNQTKAAQGGPEYRSTAYGTVLASTYVAKEHYYKTVKVADRADSDVLQAAVASLLQHITAYVVAKSKAK